MLDDLVSSLTPWYLFLRQQYRHGQALIAYASGRALPDPRFVLFGRGRSGTTALVSMLDDVPGLRCDGEVLHNAVPFPHRHVLGRCAWADTEGYGCKILSYQIQSVQSPRAPRTDFLRILHEEHGFQLLYLRRTNLLRHALSNIRARKEGFHQKKSDPNSERPPIHVDPDTVVQWMRESEALSDYERELLEGLPYLSLTYEDHIRNPNAHQATVDTICEFLGIPSAPVESSYRKVAPPSLEEGVANYDDLVRRLKGTKYTDYLD
jgi:LPS sulfotransferase NodH